MVRGLTLVVLFACVAACTGRAPNTSEGEGEGEGEGELFEGITACVDDSDCDVSSPCLDGACFSSDPMCLDERYAVVLAPPYGRLDCSRWGGTCIDGTGCVLPRGASCAERAPCAAEGGAQACVDGQCPADDVDDHLASLGATPVLLPSITTMNLVETDVDCVTATPSARGVLEVQHTNVGGSVTLYQGGFRDLVGIGASSVIAVDAVDAAPLTVCASNTIARTMTVELALTTNDALDTVCVDDDHLQRDGIVESCPAGTRCTHRVGAPACRLPAGGPCDVSGDDCVGVCERVDGVSTCSGEQPELIFDGGACRDGAFFMGGYTSTDGFAIQGIDHCGEADCLPGYGCRER